MNIWPPCWMFQRKQAEWSGGQTGGGEEGGGFPKSHSLSQGTRLECVDRKKLIWIGSFGGRGGAWGGGGGLYGPGKKKSKDAYGLPGCRIL